MKFFSKVRLALLLGLLFSGCLCDDAPMPLSLVETTAGFGFDPVPPETSQPIYGQNDPAAANRQTLSYDYYPTINTYYNHDWGEYTYKEKGEWVRSRTPPAGLLPDSTGFEEIKIRGGEPELYSKDIEKDYPLTREYPHKHHYDPNHVTLLNSDDKDDKDNKAGNATEQKPDARQEIGSRGTVPSAPGSKSPANPEHNPDAYAGGPHNAGGTPNQVPPDAGNRGAGEGGPFGSRPGMPQRPT